MRSTRWKNVLLGMYFYRMARKEARGGQGVDHRHGTKGAWPRLRCPNPFHAAPSNPWDQRLCLVPDGDLFEAIKAGRASVVTDQIETFTETGVKLRSGAELDADIIVTATGLDLLVLGGLKLAVDGRSVDLAKTFGYKGMMYTDVPNLALAFGYTNASWTLKCDPDSCEYVCRLLNHMAKTGLRQCTPGGMRIPALAEEPWVDFPRAISSARSTSSPSKAARRLGNCIRTMRSIALSLQICCYCSRRWSDEIFQPRTSQARRPRDRRLTQERRARLQESS